MVVKESFLKKFDNFGKPIGLTYKQQGSFSTAIGGVGSIVIFFVYMGWLAIECQEVYIPPGKWNVGQKKVLTQDINGNFPVYNMTGNEFFTTYRLWSFNETIDKEIDKYVSGLWVQRRNKRESGIHKGVPCESQYDPEMQSPQFMSQIKGQICPETNGVGIQLQQKNPSNDT